MDSPTSAGNDASPNATLYDKSRAVEAGVWFDDGNVIIVAQSTPFKVHRSLLSQRSSVFNDMFSIPQPPTLQGDEGMDGIPIVHVSDTWEEIAYILSALYDGYRLASFIHTCELYLIFLRF